MSWRWKPDPDTNGTTIIQLPSVKFLIYLRVYSTGQRQIMRRRRRRRKKNEEEETEATET
jgi:hypothetical protein